MTDSYDYDDLLLSLQTFMRNTDAFRDVNWDGSAAKALLRVLAYNTQLQQISNGMLFSELDINNAQIKRNVDSIATTLGYLPKGKRAASYKADIVVTPRPDQVMPTKIVLDRNAKFFAARDGVALNFTVPVEYEATLEDGKYVFKEVELIQGQWIVTSFPVQSEYSVESFVIPNKNIDTTHMKVGVLESRTSNNLEVYKRFETIYDLGSKEATYFLTVNKDGYYKVEFGDDRLSKKLSLGNVVVIQSLVTDGDIGNNAVDVSCISSVAGFYAVEVFPYQKYSFGGSDEESIDSVRRAAVLSFSSQGSAVSDSDYVAITKEIFPEAGSVVSWGGEYNDPPMFGYQMVSVIPRNSDILNDVQKQYLVEGLRKRNVGSISPIIVDPEFTYINIETDVLFAISKSVLSEQSLRVKLTTALKKYSSDKLEFFGSDFIYSSLVSFINSVDPSFIGNVTNISYTKRFNPTLNVFTNHTFKFGVPLKPGSLLVSGFTVLDIGYSGYIHQLFDSNGLVYVRRIDPEDPTNIYNFPAEVGTIDYEKGIVGLNKFKPISIAKDYGIDLKVYPSNIDPSLYNSRHSIIKINDVTVNLSSRESKKD